MEVRKILGTGKPAATVVTPLYTVPSGKEAVVSVIAACNQDPTSPDPIRIAICAGPTPSGTDSEWVVYDWDLQPKETYTLFAVPIRENNTVVVVSKNGTTSFNAFGVEL